MKIKHVTTYRLGAPTYVTRLDPETGERVRDRITPVNKVVRVVDGKENFVKMEKRVAESLEDFRKLGYREPVEGAATDDVIAARIANLTDDELEAMGLSRRMTDTEPEPDPDAPEFEPAEDDMVLDEAIESIETAAEEEAEVREFAEQELSEAEDVADFGADFFDEEE